MDDQWTRDAAHNAGANSILILSATLSRDYLIQRFLSRETRICYYICEENRFKGRYMNGRRENVCVCVNCTMLLHFQGFYWRSRIGAGASGISASLVRRDVGSFDGGRSRWIVEQGHVGCTRTLVSIYANNRLLVRQGKLYSALIAV